MTRKLMPGDRVRHKVTGHEYTFHAHPSSQDFPGSRYVRDESGAIREFRVDEIEAISTTPVSGKISPTRLDEIVAAAEEATPGEWEVIPATFEEGRRIKTPAYELMAVDIDAPYLDRTDAEHIAMMDPATTLALVAEVRELRAKVERVRHLHLPSGDPEVDSLATCDECSDLDGKAPRYPCPTIRALGEEA